MPQKSWMQGEDWDILYEPEKPQPWGAGLMHLVQRAPGLQESAGGSDITEVSLPLGF